MTNLTKQLAEALRDLLADTQHAEHQDCNEGPCPVRDAREALAAYEAAQQAGEQALPPLPTHHVPIGLLGAHHHLLHAAWAYAEGYARKAMRQQAGFPQPRKQDKPCHECHLQPGERCDICGARAAQAAQPLPVRDEREAPSCANPDEFIRFLNDRRGFNVSEVFHEICQKYRAALTQPAQAVPQRPEQNLLNSPSFLTQRQGE